MSPLVLCYHAVSPTWEHRLSIHPDLLVRQVRGLLRFRRLRATFDDAFRNAAAVFPSLQGMGVPIEIFVCTGFARQGTPLTIPELETDRSEDLAQLATLTWDELRSHADRGVEIGSHTVSHPHLVALSDREVRAELSESKEEIETELRATCNHFAYPYGEHDQRVRSLARAAGYDRAYALRGSRADSYAVPRLDLYRRHTPAQAMLLASPLRRLVPDRTAP